MKKKSRSDYFQTGKSRWEGQLWLSPRNFKRTEQTYQSLRKWHVGRLSPKTGLNPMLQALCLQASDWVQSPVGTRVARAWKPHLVCKHLRKCCLRSQLAIRPVLWHQVLDLQANHKQTRVSKLISTHTTPPQFNSSHGGQKDQAKSARIVRLDKRQSSDGTGGEGGFHSGSQLHPRFIVVWKFQHDRIRQNYWIRNKNTWQCKHMLSRQLHCWRGYSHHTDFGYKLRVPDA